MDNTKRTYNNLTSLFTEFINKEIPRMKIDHVAMGYKDARSAHRSLHNCLKGGILDICVKWNDGNVYLERTDKKWW